MPSESCQKLQTNTDSLKQIGEQIKSMTQSIKTREDIENIKQLQNKARKIMMEMMKSQQFEIFELANTTRERDMRIQREIGFLETLSNGEEGITDMFGNEHSFPTTEQILKRLEGNRETLELKLKQYHRPKLMIVPLGKSIISEEGVCFARAFEEQLIKHKDHLHNIDGSPESLKTDITGNLFENDNRPVWIWSGYQKAEQSGDLTYDESTKTKQDKIDEIGGYSIILIDDIIDLPSENDTRTKEGRTTPQANKTPQQYLDMLKTDEYKGERGHYIEETLYMYILNLIEQDGLVTDNWSKTGKATFSVGNTIKGGSSTYVPGSDWYSGSRRASLDGYDLGDSSPGYSARFGVNF